MALIAGAGLLHLVIGPLLSLGTGSPGAYQCSRNVYNCSDFRSRVAAQAAYQACGGRGNDVHRLDDDRDGLACEWLPWIIW
jgi:Excalibur calcium-binding domain